MQLKDLLTKVRGMMALPTTWGETEKRRVSVLNFLLLLLGSFSILVIIPIRGNETEDVLAILAVDVVVLCCLISIRRRNLIFPSYLIPFSLLAIDTFLIFNGKGTGDIAILGLPLIIALGGLLLGRRGSLVLAGSCTLCFGFIIWAQNAGLTPDTGKPGTPIPIDIFFIAAILLGTTGIIIHYIMRDLSRSLETTQQKEHALQKVNQDLQQSAIAMEQRTRQLLTSAKVSRAATTILEPEELCQQVVDMVCNQFGLYYVGLFLVDEMDEWAILYAATGEAGKEMLKKGHRLKIGSTSMIGWCIANQKARIALDIGSEAVRFDNPLLPETRSELALPLISRKQIIGALGIQSKLEAAFSEEDVATFQAMSDHLANAISNARMYYQLQRELAVRKKVEKKIRKMNAELEQRVAERTQELRDANENLTTLSHLKDEFLANVSHELRTPLTSITLYHNLLENHPEFLGQYIAQINRETNRLANLIESLLSLSRLDLGYAPFHPIPLDLNALTREYVTDRTPLALERGLKLILNESHHLPNALADAQMTGQVLSVLLTNAINYTPSGGIITVSTLAEENKGKRWAGFTISDTGPGIPLEDREHLFKRFFRGRIGRSSAAPGTGLGLSIAKEIVSQHGGRIEVQSEGVAGKGTTFYVWLPVTDRNPDTG